MLERFEQSVKYANNRYEVTLPWKLGLSSSRLLNNEKLAQARLASLSRKMPKELELKCRYDKALRELELNGIIQEIDPEELIVPYPIHYLPHHPAVRESSETTKVWPVFDASASGYNGVSLNDCIEAGPSLLPNLIEILIRK